MFEWDQTPSQEMCFPNASEEPFTRLVQLYPGETFTNNALMCFHFIRVLVFVPLFFILRTRTFQVTPSSQLSLLVALDSLLFWSPSLRAVNYFAIFLYLQVLFGYFLVSFLFGDSDDDFVDDVRRFDGFSFIWDVMKRFFLFFRIKRLFRFRCWFRLTCRTILMRDRRRAFLYWVPDKVLRWMLSQGLLSREDYLRIHYLRRTPFLPSPTDPLFEHYHLVKRDILSQLDSDGDRDEAERYFKSLCMGYTENMKAIATSDSSVMKGFEALPLLSNYMELFLSLYNAWEGKAAVKLQAVLRVSNFLVERFGKTVKVDPLKAVSDVLKMVFQQLGLKKKSYATSFMGDAADFLEGHALRWITDYTGWYSAFQRVIIHIVTLPVINAQVLIEHPWFLTMVGKKAIASIEDKPLMQRFEDLTSVVVDFLRIFDALIDGEDEQKKFLATISSVQGWCNEVRFLEDMIGSRSHKPGPNVITFDEFNTKVAACDKLKYKYTVARTPFSAIVAETRRRLEVISKAQRMITVLNSEKPFVVAITGLAGTGKTELVRHIHRFILRKKSEYAGLSDEILDEKIFSAIPSKNFVFENYNPENHSTVFFDEVGTIRNPNNPVHPSILAVMEHGTHVLEQAAVEKKGNVLFKSKLIILNNNSPYFGLDANANDTGIYDQGAWFRRIDAHFHATGLRNVFRKEDKSLGVKSDVASTLAVAQFQLWGFNKSAGQITTEKHGNDAFNLPDLLNILEERYADYRHRVDTYVKLDSEKFEYLQCLNFPNKFACDCCKRCDVCLKTSAGPRHFCVDSCPFKTGELPCEEDELEPPKVVSLSHYAVPQEAYATSSQEVEKTLPYRIVGAVAFCSFSAAVTLVWAPTAVFGAFKFGGILSICGGVFFYDSTLADSLEARVALFLDTNFSKAVAAINVHPATYIKYTKGLMAATISVMFASFTTASLGIAFLCGALPNVFVTVFMTAVYGYIGWRQFFRERLARILPSTFNIAKARFHAKYGIDPDNLLASCAMLITFLGGYKLYKSFTEVESKRSTGWAHSDNQDYKISPLKHVRPIMDVRASRNPWDDGRKVITFSDNRVSLDNLISRCKDNQVRLEIFYREDGKLKRDRVGGTALVGPFVISSYHSVRLLANESSTLVVKRIINGTLMEVFQHQYTTGAESVLPDETLHVDETGDVVLLNLKNVRWKDLSRFVVKGCNVASHQSFPACIVYQDAEGTLGVERGTARWTHQSVHLKNGDKLYEAWYYLFFPENSGFKTFMGICGGVMIAHTPDGSQAGIVGVLSVGTTTYDEDGNELFLAGALPINRQKIEDAKAKYTRAIPTSRPDGFPLELQDAFSNPRSHAFHGDIQDRYGGTEILGFREDARTFPKSRVELYKWEDDVFRLMPDLKHDYVPPKFRGTILDDGTYCHPGKHAIMDLKAECKHYSLVFHNTAFLQLVKDKMRYSDLAPLYSVIPFSTDPSPSLSGIPASMIHQGIKRNTAAGYPWKGKKNAHLTINADETVTPSSELVSAVHDRLSVMAEGKREWLITRGAYKDEPRSKKKVQIRKIRLFNPPDMPHYIVEHLVLSPLIQISLLARGSFHTLGGMNVYSEEWSAIRENLEEKFPCTIPGDFSKFDKGTSFSSMFSTSESDLHLIRKSPYYRGLDAAHQQAFENIFVSLATAMGDVALVVDGEFIAPGHGNGSGSADTYKKNCEVHALIAYECMLTIVHLVSEEGIESAFLDGSEDPHTALSLALYLREEFPNSSDRLEKILENIVVIKHGDDGLYCVTQHYVSLFNFVSFQHGYNWMGVKFTPSDKSDAVFSHKSWDDVDIGKRRWLWNEELQTYLAPIEKASIGKMLTIGLVVGQTLAEKREIGVQDAMREFAQYGRREYEERLGQLADLCKEWNVPLNTQTDWKEVVISLRRSREYSVIADDQKLAQAAESAVQTEICHLSSTKPSGQALDVAQDLNAKHSADEKPLTATSLVMHATMDNNNTSGTTGASVATSDNNDDPNHQEKVESSGNPESENVKFVESLQTYSLEMPSSQDATFSETDARDAGFAGFLERYIELSTVEWTVGTDLLSTLDVWTLWRSNARIAEKLKHFRYMRMELEVRFVVSGTPFHYGQVMAAYAPLLNYWGKDFQTGATATAQKAKSSLYNFRHYLANPIPTKEITDSYFSTFPHVMIMPGDNTPVSMTLPFIWTNNALRVNKTNQANSDGTTSRESPGSVVLTDLIHLSRASDTASKKVEISIWCRAKNISLNTPTVAVATSETKEAVDSGFVSKMASNVTSASQAAGKIPMLAPYAKATEVAASTMGSIATLFGFSRPTNPSPAENYGVMNARNIAVTNISDNSQKLTFDAHQEVSVDSRVIGHDGSDEMAIASLVKRWYWCGKAKWLPTTTDGLTLSKGQIALEPKLLYRSLVSPMQWRHETTNHTVARDAWHMSPAAYVANTFRHWRGSFSYRIQVIASKYHQGRLKIQFDPFSGSSTSDQVETRFTWILDLAEAREIEVTIPYTSYRAYLDVMALSATSTQDPHFSNTTTATTEGVFDETEHMGFLSISIVNDLVSPNGVGATAGEGDAWVSVWSRMEDDAEFQVPATAWHNNIIQCTGTSEQAAPQSSTVLPTIPEEETKKKKRKRRPKRQKLRAVATSDGDFNAEEEEVIGASADPTPMWSVMESPDRTKIFFGERVLSLRALMKRFIYVTNVAHEESSYKGRLIQRVTLPHWQPPSVSGQNRKNNYQMYFAPAFLARRGSQRFKCYNFQSTNGITTDTNSRKEAESAYNVERKRSATYIGEAYNITRLNDTSSTVNASTYNTHVSSGAAGGAVVGYDLGHELIEVESPYYKPLRFDLSVWTEASLTPLDDGVDYLRFTSVMNANDNCTKHFAYYAAAGEDMSLMFFLAAPVIYSS